MIQLNHVSVAYRGKPLLADIHCSLPENKLTAIIGPNGAGKSTLMRVMAGGVRPAAGEVLFNGVAVSGLRRDQFARCRAVLSQDLDISFPLKVREVVALGRAMYREPEHLRQKIVLASLDRAAASDLSERGFTTLSGGERQRVHFARVLAQLWGRITGAQPALLLLDEPTNAMDIRHQRMLLAELRKLVAEGLTVCCILHDLNLAAIFADHAWVLKQGELVAQGPPAGIFQGEALSSVYATNLLVVPHPSFSGRVCIAYGPD